MATGTFQGSWLKMVSGNAKSSHERYRGSQVDLQVPEGPQGSLKMSRGVSEALHVSQMRFREWQGVLGGIKDVS